jgi:hypothetical protein
MGLVDILVQHEAERTNRSFEDVFAEFFEQEHSNAVICAKDNYDGWIDLIIWDLLMIPDAYKKLTETNDSQEYQKCFNLLKGDIDILNNQNESINKRYNTAGQALHPAPAAPSAAEPRGIIPFGSSLARSCPCKHGRDLASFVNKKICKVSESNWHLVRLAGYIDETLGILDEQHKQDFIVLIDKMKTSVHNFVTNTNVKNIKDFIWAEETWDKLPQKAKHQILYDLEDIVGEEGPIKYG